MAVITSCRWCSQIPRGAGGRCQSGVNPDAQRETLKFVRYFWDEATIFQGGTSSENGTLVSTGAFFETPLPKPGCNFEVLCLNPGRKFTSRGASLVTLNQKPHFYQKKLQKSGPDPDQIWIRSGPDLDQVWIRSGQIWSALGQIWSDLGQIWSDLDQI